MTDHKKTAHDFDFIGRILTILKILREQTDEHTTISQPEILEQMKKQEHPCSARTLTDYLKVMMKELNPEDEDGFVDDRFSIPDYKIIPKGLEDKLHARDLGLEKEGSKKLQLRSLRYNHIFSFEELDQIVEAVLFLKHINPEAKENLIRKLQSLSSINYPKYSSFISETTRKISKGISSVFEDSRVDEAVVRQNLTLIRKAIEADGGAGRKISFHFNSYNEKKQLVLRTDAKGEAVTYVASPYHVILYNGKYYMICNVEPYNDVSFYRIDLMSGITDQTNKSALDHETVVTGRRRAKRQVGGLPLEWDDDVASAFQTEHMNMFYGTPCRIRLKLDRDRYTFLHDYFGNQYSFKRHLDDRWDEVEVTCVPKAMESWAMQCADYVEVLSPEELRKSILGTCKMLCERYK